MSDKILCVLVYFVIFLLEYVWLDTRKFDFDLMTPEYYDYHTKRRLINLREKFLEKQNQKIKIENFDRYVLNNTVYVDEISHFEIPSNLSKWQNVLDIENDFKDLISMKTMKYVYQRGAHWRTWRVVKDRKGKKNIICYKCQSILRENCTECATSGVWVIEETPPCPYELFSVINNNELCASNYIKFVKNLTACPSVISSADLTKHCNNPIVTRWRFTRNFRVPGRSSNVICKGRDFCEILTVYDIQPEHIIFRIIDQENVIFSRIMKVNKKNFACIGDCGVANLTTYKVSRTKSKSEHFDLMKKTKRDEVDVIKEDYKEYNLKNIIQEVRIDPKYKKEILKKESHTIDNNSKKSRYPWKLPKNVVSWQKTANGYFIGDTELEITTKKCKNVMVQLRSGQVETFDSKEPLMYYE